MKNLWHLGAMILASVAIYANADNATITVNVDQPGIKVSQTLYGIFFEEINRAGEGGLFSELIQNRSFEDSKTETSAWTITKRADAEGAISLDSGKSLNDKNPTALKIEVKKGRVGAANAGFNGIRVQLEHEYIASFYARAEGGFAGPISVNLENAVGRTLAQQQVKDVSGDWKQYTVTLRATDVDSDARFVIASASPGTFYIDMVSLLSKEKWKRQNYRPDLANMVADMKPAFFRFPGGCWIEGETMATAYRWKDTIGPVETRKSNYNIWRYTCGNYVGYHEYLQLCEDIGAAPLFVINCGMSHKEVVPMDKMGEFVQDAIDAIEYANGPVDSKWGAMRAAAGHPAPFNLKYLQIGNENGHKEYNERYTLFYDAVKAKYPDVTLFSCYWGGTKPKDRPIEILDEHYYMTPKFFIANANRYDTYDRKGDKIYVGEYAVTQGCGGGNLIAALGEAAFMTGMERNSDVVVMASYAPLLANVHYKTWHPNAINFDGARVFGTPSYYVQSLFANNRADVILKSQMEMSEEPDTHAGRIALGTWATQAEFKDIKVTTPDGQTLLENSGASLEGWNSLNGEWSTKDGVIQQTSDREGSYLTAGDPKWQDYTVTLKARKISGREGFLIRFHSLGRDDFAMLNLGGWGNTRHQIEFRNSGETPEKDRVNGRIETGKWYDIKLEVTGNHVKASLDGKQLIDMDYPKSGTFFSVAGKSGDDVILKVVNVSTKPRETNIQLNGITAVESANEIVLTSGSPDDENSLENPTKVYPKSRALDVSSGSFKHVFAPNSVTILRVKVK